MKKNPILFATHKNLSLFLSKFQTKSLKGILLGLFLSIGLIGCSEGNSNGYTVVLDETKIDDIIKNLSEGHVTPGYLSFDSSLQSLEAKLAKISDVSSEIDSVGLVEAREAFKVSYLNWVRISSFQFGVASTQNLNVSLNFFSINLVIVESNLAKIRAKEPVDLYVVSQRSARGFTALDYLLYSEASVSEQLKALNSGLGYKEYIGLVASHMKDSFGSIYSAWNLEGKKSFEAAGGVASGSSMSTFVNEFNVDFEQNSKTKRVKSALGLPGTQVKPTEVEAYYSKFSKQLLTQHISSLSDVYEGNSFAGVEGYGLVNYLESKGTMVEVDGNSILLSVAISNQFTNILTSIEKISGSIDQAVENDYESIKATYDELQKMVLFTKVKMPSALGVQITYIDNDGD
jgi:uncharacterized protein